MYRYERKYYVRNTIIDGLRKRLIPFVDPDSHANPSTNGLPQYTVRSIYYDSPVMEYYHEKMDGLENRSKYRIRVYDDYKPGEILFVEIKRKLGNRIKKHRSTILVDDIQMLLNTGEAERFVIRDKNYEEGLKDANKFLFHYYKHSLRPVNLVTYDREAYHGKFDHGVRITLDKNVRTKVYPHLDELYNESHLKAVTSNHFILEIKYFNIIPSWATSIVEEFGLSHEAISKYSTGIDVHTPGRMRFSPIGMSRLDNLY
ncbi:MAG TPA: polyphosphate polymerase domain-containing protein [Cytophagaceae bacterium]|jgi:hypothetical protein